MNFKSIFTRSLFLAFSLSASELCHAANLISNGSFELGIFSPPSNNTQSLAIGSTVMPSWTVTGDTLAWISNSANPWNLAASEGNFFLDLTNYEARAPFGGVTQTISTTAGQSYELSFDLGSSTYWGRPSAIRATAAGASSVFTSALTGTDSDWEHFTMQFTATSASTTISLLGESGVNYIGLDNVAVNEVPIPSSVWFLGSGLVSLTTLKRRRSKMA